MTFKKWIFEGWIDPETGKFHEVLKSDKSTRKTAIAYLNRHIPKNMQFPVEVKYAGIVYPRNKTGENA